MEPAGFGAGRYRCVRNGRVESAANVGIRQPFDLADRLRGSIGLPVLVVNDTQAAAIAEASQLGRATNVLLRWGPGSVAQSSPAGGWYLEMARPATSVT
jgi:hypothetical protein